MTVIHFEEVKFRATKRMKCADGKTRTRSITFTNTVNPFNKNKDGTIRTRNQVYECVKTQGMAWMKEPITDY